MKGMIYEIFLILLELKVLFFKDILIKLED